MNRSTPGLPTAKSIQSCPTLCDPIDSSPPGSPVPGILQARTLEWGAISFSNAWKWKVKVKLLSRVWLLATPWTAAYRAALPIEFSRQEYWSGVPLPSPQTSLSITNSWSLPKLMSIESVMPTQTRYHQVSDAIQPSHPLSSPSPPALNLSQHQGLFRWVSSSHQVAKVLKFQL